MVDFCLSVIGRSRQYVLAFDRPRLSVRGRLFGGYGLTIVCRSFADFYSAGFRLRCYAGHPAYFGHCRVRLTVVLNVIAQHKNTLFLACNLGFCTFILSPLKCVCMLKLQVLHKTFFKRSARYNEVLKFTLLLFLMFTL